MLEKLKTFVRGVIRKMFPAKSIEQVLDVKPCISSVMQERIEFGITCILEWRLGAKIP